MKRTVKGKFVFAIGLLLFIIGFVGWMNFFDYSVIQDNGIVKFTAILGLLLILISNFLRKKGA
ncbi:hypothetical protein ACU3L3_16970 [Priestia endophytica]|jgi:hypothetical protein|uniref:Uncharacterized protein n=1 Tax=Priestia endophytica DSM 13796 TaxID=1121089 RepID=A0A1I5YVP8_9BACI|nr:hypothetical protein [Priestia endophytica]KYG27999.1 hypothetical protein AZF06_13530 [Priestia endophytica]MBG9813983.1 hypothetical protein [Priestia endophytica]RAS79114.1 hypothetical protein A4R27_14910 [Priestia endophytica]SFQ48304.1 hypothetical protein SAMN02745910_01604 [Priestia endophytica DSM 13796]